jgi:hypothetical protein
LRFLQIIEVYVKIIIVIKSYFNLLKINTYDLLDFGTPKSSTYDLLDLGVPNKKKVLKMSIIKNKKIAKDKNDLKQRTL